MLVGFAGCDLMSHSHCDDKTLSELKSPDGTYVAILSHRSCVNGASFTSVKLRENTLLFGDDEYVLMLAGVHEISGVWNDPNHLEIRSEAFQDEKAVLTEETSWKTVSISYKE
jgi:hypothetical protein